ncbi:sensor domain-containing phosphodiesterase [Mycoplana dimorpha]|uniref:EAL domain-containing protein (Putative c-di-GMP-specific phosphodiesterase class I) n=1 Tax=Mycoplana dimorpha TaxID=28320 RepID=A0A2T5AQU9_MYCDI|nr:EAL domain-containing protein [Mycoplana dimorpha]PTM89111.1 EAL domain-containing protein (putative c-di-GMP-specific phosphodiesterase class I) [Mycoplana dimorpha]
MSAHTPVPVKPSIDTAGEAPFRRLFKAALTNGSIWPAFQPIVCLRSGRITGFEVLARWTDPTGGELSPAILVLRLEAFSLLDELLDALLLDACGAAIGWPGEFKLAFNVSSSQLSDRHLRQRFIDASHKTGFPLDRLEIEITETTLTVDAERTLAELQAFDMLGIAVAIDDFGTGYSSLSRLEAFPFKKLKIDRQFVSALDQSRSKRRFAAAMIGLGQSLGMTVVAEGVESKKEEAILRELGCHYVQGWLYGRPVQGEKAALMIVDRGRATSVDFAHARDVSPFQQVHQLASLYDQAPVGLCYLDMDFCHIRANRHFASLHNLSVEELEGRTIRDILQGETLEAAGDMLDRCLEQSDPVRYVWTVGGRNVRAAPCVPSNRCRRRVDRSLCRVHRHRRAGQCPADTRERYELAPNNVRQATRPRLACPTSGLARTSPTEHRGQ